ncbi:MAG: NHL repeat-containing protein [Bacillota bacterium]
MLYEQTWDDAANRPELFQVLGYKLTGDRVTQLEAADMFVAPFSIAVDQRGYIYVSDTQAMRIQRIGPDGELLAPFNLDRGHYTDLGVDKAGFVYVLNSGFSPAVRKLDSSGAVVGTWPVQTKTPLGLRVQPSGGFYVKYTKVDSSASEIAHYGHDGNLVETVPGSREDTYTYEDDKGSQYRVLRVGANQVQLQVLESGVGRPVIDYLESENDLVNRVIGFGAAGRLYRFMDIQNEAKDGFNHLYVQVINPARGETYTVDLGPSQELLMSATKVTVDLRGNIYYLATSTRGMKIIRYSPIGPN